MEIMEPVASLPYWLVLAKPQEPVVADVGKRPNDDVQRAAESIGRTNAAYDDIWDHVRRAPDGYWIPVRCNNMRRALLLASAGLQHRTLSLEVWRRGRVVCIRRRASLVQDQVPEGAPA